MGREQDGDECGQQEDVHRIDAGDQAARRELAPEEDGGEPRAQEGDRLRDRVGDTQADARQQIVGQRVPEHAVAQDEQEQPEPDQPVDAARPPVRAGEEHAEEVHHDGGGEDERRPVVDLPHEQPGAHVEAQLDGRAVRVRHVHALQGCVAPFVHDLGGRGVEEERKEDAGRHEDDEAVQGDLAEEEGPMVREDVPQLLPDHPRPADAVVDPAGDRGHGTPAPALAGRRRAAGLDGGAHDGRSQKPGPIGVWKSDWATSSPGPWMASGN